MPISRTRTIALTLVMSVAAVALVAACGDDDDDAAMSLTLSGDECTYEGPTQVGEGSVVIVVENRNDADAHFTVFLLREGRFDSFAEEIDQKRALIEEEGEVAGGLGGGNTPMHSAVVDPGESGELRFTLLAGDYALNCVNFVSEKPFSPFTSKITVWPPPTPLQVTE